MSERNKTWACPAFSKTLLLLAFAWGVAFVPSFGRAPDTTAATEAPHVDLLETFEFPDLGTTDSQQADSILFSQDGKRLYASAWGNLRGWHIKGERTILDVPFDGTRRERPLNLTLTPDGRYLIAVGTRGVEGAIFVWEARTGALAKWWRAHGRAADSVACHPGGKLFATGGEDGVVRLWAFPSCREVRHLRLPEVVKGYIFRVDHLAFVPPGRRLLIWAGRWYFWDLESGKLKCLEKAEGLGSYPTLSKDGKKIASAFDRPVAGAKPAAERAVPAAKVFAGVRVSDGVTTNKLFDLDQEHAWWLAFHRDGRHLLLLTDQGDLVCWDLQTRRRTATWRLPYQPTRVAALSPAGDLLATCHQGCVVQLRRLILPKAP